MSRRSWGIDEKVRKYLLDHSLREPAASFHSPAGFTGEGSGAGYRP